MGRAADSTAAALREFGLRAGPPRPLPGAARARGSLGRGRLEALGCAPADTGARRALFAEDGGGKNGGFREPGEVRGALAFRSLRGFELEMGEG